MKEMKGKVILLSMVVTLICFAGNIYAQTIEDVIEAFNAGAEALNAGENESAIENLEKCVTISEQVGSEADEHKIKAMEYLPNLYYGVALDIYKEKKYENAIKQLEKTIEVSKKYEDPNTEGKAVANLPKFYYAYALNYYKAKDYVNAKSRFKKAIELDPEYINAYFYLALSEKNSEDEDAMIENFKKIIEIGPATNSTVKKTTQTLANHYQNTGKKAINSADFETAAEAFETSFKYMDEDGDTYYYIAMAYNKLNSWDKALENALKAVELATGSEEDIAKVNYELARAYEGRGDKDNACATYSKAAVGRFEESAKYQMEHVLECSQ